MKRLASLCLGLCTTVFLFLLSVSPAFAGVVGNYENTSLGAELQITQANNSNGQGSGVFTMGDSSVPVSIHYHFVNSVGPETTLVFWGFQDDPNVYVGGSGAIENVSQNTGIELAGSMAGTDTEDVVGFSGFFK